MRRQLIQRIPRPRDIKVLPRDPDDIRVIPQARDRRVQRSIPIRTSVPARVRRTMPIDRRRPRGAIRIRVVGVLGRRVTASGRERTQGDRREVDIRRCLFLNLLYRASFAASEDAVQLVVDLDLFSVEAALFS